MSKKEELLKLFLLSKVIIRSGDNVSVCMTRANKPVLENSAIILADKIKRMGDFNWVYGDVEESPDLVGRVSMILNARTFFPKKGLYVPAISPFSKEDYNVIFVRSKTDDDDIREIVEFCKHTGNDIDEVAAITLFDFRKIVNYSGINLESIFQKNDIFSGQF